MSDQQIIAKLLKLAAQLQVVKRGKFKLASGQESDYYLDGRLLSLHPEGAYLIGEAIYHRLGDSSSVGGPAVGAVPIITATLLAAQRRHQPLAGFYVSSQPKKHGTAQAIEGRASSPATVVDDTATTGGSILKTIQALAAQEIETKQVIVLFDRGGGQQLNHQPFHYCSLLRVDRDGELGITHRLDN